MVILGRFHCIYILILYFSSFTLLFFPLKYFFFRFSFPNSNSFAPRNFLSWSQSLFDFSIFRLINKPISNSLMNFSRRKQHRITLNFCIRRWNVQAYLLIGLETFEHYTLCVFLFFMRIPLNPTALIWCLLFHLYKKFTHRRKVDLLTFRETFRDVFYGMPYWIWT